MNKEDDSIFRIEMNGSAIRITDKDELIKHWKNELKKAESKIKELKKQSSSEERKFWMKLAIDSSPAHADNVLEHYNKKFFGEG